MITRSNKYIQGQSYYIHVFKKHYFEKHFVKKHYQILSPLTSLCNLKNIVWYQQLDEYHQRWSNVWEAECTSSMMPTNDALLLGSRILQRYCAISEEHTFLFLASFGTWAKAEFPHKMNVIAFDLWSF